MTFMVCLSALVRLVVFFSVAIIVRCTFYVWLCARLMVINIFFHVRAHLCARVDGSVCVCVRGRLFVPSFGFTKVDLIKQEKVTRKFVSFLRREMSLF